MADAFRQFFGRSTPSVGHAGDGGKDVPVAFTDREPVPPSPTRSASAMPSRGAVFATSAHAVATVVTVLFDAINEGCEYAEPAGDATTTRRAKLLFVALLESVQKERGEWRGFHQDSADAVRDDGDSSGPQNPRDVVKDALSDVAAPLERLCILNDLLAVSFRNLRSPLVPFELYAEHKPRLALESLAVPPGLDTLRAIRGVLDALEMSVKQCLFRLLALWDAMALANGEGFPLLKTIETGHHRVFGDATEFDGMTGRTSGKNDVLAMELLQVMVLYRDLLFSDIEFIVAKQEMHVSKQLVDASRRALESRDAGDPELSRAIPQESEVRAPASVSRGAQPAGDDSSDDGSSSDADDSSDNSSDSEDQRGDDEEVDLDTSVNLHQHGDEREQLSSEATNESARPTSGSRRAAGTFGLVVNLSTRRSARTLRSRGSAKASNADTMSDTSSMSDRSGRLKRTRRLKRDVSSSQESYPVVSNSSSKDETDELPDHPGILSYVAFPLVAVTLCAVAAAVVVAMQRPRLR